MAKSTWTERFRVAPEKPVKLGKIDPGDTAGLQKEEAEERLQGLLAELAELQYTLFAEAQRAMLVVFQAMDTGGKDGVIRHVIGAVNPQGLRVVNFKVPTGEELRHDFLWRVHQATPGKGELGVFNRSHYEDVLVVRVHDLVPKKVWSARYEQINNFEKLLGAADVHILKFFLHISKDEQLQRLTARLEQPRKMWKVNPQDFEEREYWDDYMAAYQDALSRCSTDAAPWFVIPANQKWFRDLAVASIMVEKLRSLKLQFPQPSFDVKELLKGIK